MIKMIKWPSIEQFRQVVKNVQHRAAYVGMDENGDPRFDKSRKSPTLRYEGTVKLHGTNAAVGIKPGAMWCQSRENIITPEKDNAGFAMFAYNKQDTFYGIAGNVAEMFDMDTKISEKSVLIFGEWCGGNIQKTVAIAELSKMFVIFGIAIVEADDTQKTYLTCEQVKSVTTKYSDITKVSTDQITSSGHQGIYSIYNFQTFEVEIDFENPHLIQNELNKLTEFVGDICSVVHSFGVDGIGEGIVWRCIEEGYEDSGFWFKVKDDRHSNSKVKTLATVDVQRIENIKELAEQLANNGRLMQMSQSVFNTLNGGEVDIKKTGDFIRTVMSDIAKEDLDIIAASGFNMKEVSGPISKICRDFLLNNLT